MIIELAKGITLIITLGFFQGLILRRINTNRLASSILSGLLFGIFCVLGMSTPLNFSSGVIIDARSVILSMAGYFGGPLVGSIAALIASSYRLSLGGVGEYVGVSVIVVCVLLGLVYRYFTQRNWVSSGFIQLLLFGVIVHLVCLGLFLFLPTDISESIFEDLAVYYLLVFAPATLLLGYLLKDIQFRLETEKKLAESEEFFKKTTDSSPLAIYMSEGEEQRAAYMNNTFTELFGYNIDEVPTVTEWWPLAYPDPEYRDSIEKEWERKVKHAIETESKIIPMETVVTCKDGSTRIVSWSFMSNDNKNWAFGLDLTERKESEELLRHSQKMEAVGQLTGGIAHDFNNILGIIMGNLEIIKMKLSPDSEFFKYIESAYKGSMRGKEITRKLLMFTRKEAATSQLTDLNRLILGIKSLIQKSITPSIQLHTNITENLWETNVDPGDFEDAIINLSLNARDAMPNGGSLTIETANKFINAHSLSNHPECSAGEYVEISVTDTGIGMTKEIIDKAFQPFFTTKEKSKGTGLGLSMVYGFIQRSNGYVEIHSEKGKGTTVCLYFPKSKNNQPNHDYDSEVLNSQNELPGGKETILVVDDEKALIEIARDILQNLGYTVVSAQSGKEVLDILEKRNQEIDLIFSDILMPGSLDGFDVGLEVLKHYPDIKCLLTSGHIPGEDIVRGNDPRIIKLSKNILNKPYEVAELANSVRKTLDE